MRSLFLCWMLLVMLAACVAPKPQALPEGPLQFAAIARGAPERHQDRLH